jgi:hypothetical protein
LRGAPGLASGNNGMDRGDGCKTGAGLSFAEQKKVSSEKQKRTAFVVESQ